MKRVLFGLVLFGLALVLGYLVRSDEIADCKKAGGTWVSTSSKTGYCQGGGSSVGSR